MLIAHHLTEANRKEVLAEITRKTKGQVEMIAARLKPQADVPASVRRVHVRPAAAPLSAGAVSISSATPSTVPVPVIPRPVIAPLAPARFKLQITMNQETHDTLRQLQDLLRHSIPNGDPALIVERALGVLHKEVLKRKCGIVDRPRRIGDSATVAHEATAGGVH